MRVTLPFYCDPIPSEHDFGGTVTNIYAGDGDTGLIEAIEVDANVARIGLGRSWDKIQRTDDKPDPQLTLSLTWTNGQTVCWYWWGDGSYDRPAFTPPGT